MTSLNANDTRMEASFTNVTEALAAQRAEQYEKGSVPLVDLRANYAAIQSEIDEAMAKVLGSCWFVGGPVVTEFENKFAQFCETEYCIGCNRCVLPSVYPRYLICTLKISLSSLLQWDRRLVPGI